MIAGPGVIAAYAGSRLTGKLPEWQLKAIIAAGLLAAGANTIRQALSIDHQTPVAAAAGESESVTHSNSGVVKENSEAVTEGNDFSTVGLTNVLRDIQKKIVEDPATAARHAAFGIASGETYSFRRSWAFS